MSQKALGMIETLGILAAYEAADVALKSANVKMVGYEISRGGLVVVKFTGDVSAVRSAVDAAKAAASQLSKVWSSHVIARPAKEIENMINSEDTVNRKNQENETIKKEETAEDNNPETEFEDDEITKTDAAKANKDEFVDSENKEDNDEEKNQFDFENEEFEADKDDSSDESEAVQDKESTTESEAEETEEEDICNLCGDPACPRSKGDLHKDCIHYDEIKNDE